MGVMQVNIDDIKSMIKQRLEKDPNKLLEAEAILNQLLNKHPDDWGLLFLQGSLQMHLGRNGLSVALLKRCSELQPKIPEIYNNIGTAYRREHLNEDAETWLKKALEFREDDPDVYNNLGTLHVNEGTPEIGEEYLRKAIKYKPDHAHAHWNLGLTLLEQEKWEEGFKEYAWGLTTKDRMVKSYGNAQWWHGEPHQDKTLVIYGEQGIGDEIMFFSMIEEVMPMFKQVILDVHPRLINMFQRAFPQLDMYPTRKIWDKPVDWADKYKIDYKVPMGNLGAFLRKKESDFPRKPYISALKEKVEEYKEWLKLLGPGPYIGLGWVGGHKKTRKDLRAIKLEEWQPLFDAFPDATFISFQYTDHGREDTKRLYEEKGIRVWHFPEVMESALWERWIYKDITFKDKEDMKAWAKQNGVNTEDVKHFTGPGYDYDEVAAMAQAVHDLGGTIATINTSLVHLCGSMGLPIFVATPSRPAWRYGLTRKDMVWYPKDSIHQFRQKDDDWSDVVKDITKAVKEYLEVQCKQVA